MQPQPQSPQVNLTFSPEALSVVLEGLALLPLGRSRTLFDSIQAEAQKQLAPAAEPATPETPPAVKPKRRA